MYYKICSFQTETTPTSFACLCSGKISFYWSLLIAERFGFSLIFYYCITVKEVGSLHFTYTFLQKFLNYAATFRDFRLTQIFCKMLEKSKTNRNANRWYCTVILWTAKVTNLQLYWFTAYWGLQEFSRSIN